MIGVPQTLGFLWASLLILGTFPTGLAWLGVATGAIGAVPQVLPPVFGWAHVPCGVLLPVWLTGIAFALWALGEPALRNRQREAAEAIEPAQPQAGLRAAFPLAGWGTGPHLALLCPACDGRGRAIPGRPPMVQVRAPRLAR